MLSTFISLDIPQLAISEVMEIQENLNRIILIVCSIAMEALCLTNNSLIKNVHKTMISAIIYTDIGPYPNSRAVYDSGRFRKVMVPTTS